MTKKLRPKVCLWALLIAHTAIAVWLVCLGIWFRQQVSALSVEQAQNHYKEDAIKAKIKTMTDVHEMRALTLHARERYDAMHTERLLLLRSWDKMLLDSSIMPAFTAMVLAYLIYAMHQQNRRP